MNRETMARPPIKIPTKSSSIALVPLRRQIGVSRGFHGFQFGVDLFGRFQFGDLFLEAFRAGHAERVGASLGEVGAALEELEARERVLGAAAADDLARLGPGDRALE